MDYDKKMPISKEIELSELKEAIDKIFEHLQEDLNLNKISLDHDYYADIGLVDKFEVLADTKDADFLEKINLGLGQLSDDWGFLEGMIKDNSAVALMFEHVAPLLRYIAYKALSQSMK